MVEGYKSLQALKLENGGVSYKSLQDFPDHLPSPLGLTLGLC